MSWIDTLAPTGAAEARSPDPRVISAPTEAVSERLAAWVLRAPLTLGLGLLAMGQLLVWVPHYLTWPLYADHDVFATLARHWDEGRPPYRASFGNNFPGTIYLFWLVGQLVGWGPRVPVGFFALDAALLVALGGLTLAWSRRSFGRVLPGLVGYLAVLSYYLDLDYTQVAQRDWQAPVLGVAALLVLGSESNRARRVVSALLAAFAVTIRPQAVLFLPALAVALALPVRQPGACERPCGRAILEWGLAFGIGLALGFAPLGVCGVWSDFLRSVRLAGYGGPYSQVGPSHLVKQVVRQGLPFQVWAVVVPVALLVGQARPRTRRLVLVWAVAALGVALYKPLSPVPHAYLDHPLWLIWALGAGLLIQVILECPCLVPSLRLTLVVLVLGSGVTAYPRFCNVERSLEALAGVWRPVAPALPPVGYTVHPEVPNAAPYPWDDYHALLSYLRRTTEPTTPLANALKGFPALAGALGRPSAFPAESLAWLRLVRPEDEAAFARALRHAPEAVVVWIPDEAGPDSDFDLALLSAVIRELYEPGARFGDLEVWRRKPAATATRPTVPEAHPRRLRTNPPSAS